jgi:hypothetical protein
MTARIVLEVIAGPNQGARFEFDRHDTFLVGRAPTAHLQLLDDAYFSRHHFLLECQPPRCYLRDLGSSNGTLVNGQKVTECFLRDGDLISGRQNDGEGQKQSAQQRCHKQGGSLLSAFGGGYTRFSTTRRRCTRVGCTATGKARSDHDEQRYASWHAKRKDHLTSENEEVLHDRHSGNLAAGRCPDGRPGIGGGR